MEPVRSRYAPSPTGSPHVGNLRTAIFDWLIARKTGGQFITRLEDTDRDPTRYKPEAIHELEDSLRWLGIEPDEWWVSGGPHGPYVQSERLPLYRAAADRLVESGAAYKCFCTEDRLREMREDQQARGVPSGYDRRCRTLSADDRAAFEAQGLAYTVRLAVPLEGQTTYTDVVYGTITFENRNVDDQVLLKSNGWPTYHLGVVVDDHHMAINCVIRGEDWLPSTPKQVLLYNALGWEQPIWCHIPLTLGSDRKKLGKRHGSTQFVDFIRQGYLPEAMFNFLVLLGWSAGDENLELMSVDEILQRFSLEGIIRTPAIFDYDKLRWMNGEYIRKADPDRLCSLVVPYLVGAGLVPSDASPAEMAYVRQVAGLITDRMKLLCEAPELSRYFFIDPAEPDEKGRKKWLVGSGATDLLTACEAAMAAVQADFTPSAIEEAVNQLAESRGIGRGPIIHTLRVAVSGQTTGPSLFDMLAVMGAQRVLRRVARAREWVTE